MSQIKTAHSFLKTFSRTKSPVPPGLQYGGLHIRTFHTPYTEHGKDQHVLLKSIPKNVFRNGIIPIARINFPNKIRTQWKTFQSKVTHAQVYNKVNFFVKILCHIKDCITFAIQKINKQHQHLKALYIMKKHS